MTPAAFPHSEILGSTPAYGSPRLIAVNHVLLRLLTPRHPPCALTSLTANLLRLPGELEAHAGWSANLVGDGQIYRDSPSTRRDHH